VDSKGSGFAANAFLTLGGWTDASETRAPSRLDVRKSDLDALGKSRGSQPNKVGDAPLLERVPRGVSQRTKSIAEDKQETDRRCDGVLGARDVKMKKSASVGGAH
jgi:hypothetical protein